MAALSASTLVAVTSRQVPAGLDASRVVSRNPVPARAQPFAADPLPDDLHQGADGELWKMAEIGHQTIVRNRIHDSWRARRRPTPGA